MDANNIGENLCSVITMVSKSLLEGLKYDTTIECTVIDDSKGDSGEYRVSNGSASFIALSTSKYKNNDKVYVTIPGGDYDNDKLIVGKVSVKDAQEPYNYIAPLTSFYNISGNLNPKPNDKWSLLANGDTKSKQIFVKENLSLAGFTRLGLKASFKSWLPTKDCVFGDYGLRLEITFKVDKTVNGDSAFDYITKDLFLNTQDMVGNPYVFEIEFNQEKMFNISELGEITGIKVFFLQSGTFMDRQFKPIVHTEPKEIEDDKEPIDLPDNLWVSNIEIGVGYDINDYPGEFLQLYTLDSLYYNPKYDAETNRKEIALRWLHEGPNGKYQIDENSTEEPFEIRWYKYKLGNPSPDEYVGVNWELINLEDDGTCGRRFTAVFDPEIKQQQESIKVITLYGEAPGYYDYAAKAESFFKDDEDKINKDIFDRDFKNYYVKDKNAKDEVYYRRLARDDWDNLANLTLAYKVDSREVYHSEPIVFKNEKAMPNESTMAALSALKIYCYDVEDGKQTLSAGNYLLYNEQNELIDKAQSQIDRYLVWGLDIDDFDVNNVSNITWTFPTDKTMIAVADLSDEDLAKGSITITDGKAGNEQHDKLNGFKYHIENKYSISKTNNTIGLSVTHSGIVYTAAIELSFGQAGTMGSKGTFVIDFVDARTAITIGETEPIGLVARLYGINGDEISLNNYSVKWDWHICPSMLKADDTNGLEFKTTEGTTCELQPTPNLAMSQMYIVKATLQGWQTESIDGSYDLIAFLPIPLRAEAKYRYITGADKVVYLSDGTPQYYDGYYIMHTEDEEGNPIALCNGWDIKNHYTYPYPSQQDQDNMSIYDLGLKKVAQEDKSVWCKLNPSPLYYEGSTTYYTVEYTDQNGMGWTQPILIIQSRYFSSMINDWDGKTIHLDEENGDILASRIGAGRKNSSNQFSGVLMGDWSEKIEGNTITNTGLYGFRDGLLSFGFKDDGTAFIGTKTKGQLQFDGNESTITSASYRTGIAPGMLLDFDNPQILLRQYSRNIVPLVTTKVDSYQYYGTYTSEDQWKNATWNVSEITGKPLNVRVTTYLETGTDDAKTYEKVEAWSDAKHKDQKLYEKILLDKQLDPLKLLTEEEFNKALEDWAKMSENTDELNYFIFYYENGEQSIDITKWEDLEDLEKEKSITLDRENLLFYYPSKKTTTRLIRLEADSKTVYPLQIGSNFKVSWDGALNASDGSFSGYINAKSGTISGELSVTGTLSGGTISGARVYTTYLSAYNGTIGGWNIDDDSLSGGTMALYSNGLYDSENKAYDGIGTLEGGRLYASTGNMLLKGYLKVEGTNGFIGQINSGVTDGNLSENDLLGVGLRYTGEPDEEGNKSNSEVKATAANTGLKYNEAYLSLNDKQILMVSQTGNAAIKLFDPAAAGSSYPNGRIYIQSGAIDLVGPTKATNTLTVENKLTVSKNGASITGATIIDGGLEVTGTTALGDKLTIYTGGATITGETTLNDKLTVSSGGASITGGLTTVSGSPVTLNGTSLVVTVPAENQSGIYARFA